MLLTTNNPVLIRRFRDLPVLMCAQKKSSKKIPDEDDFIASNIASFGNDIGPITNRATSMYEVMAAFEPGSPEQQELSYRIMCGQLMQQNEID